jgi:uncharacterized coiled-coil protein SlyX
VAARQAQTLDELQLALERVLQAVSRLERKVDALSKKLPEGEGDGADG